MNIHFDSMDPGVYAISVLHDADQSGDMEMGGVFSLIPKEGFGYSNNPKIILPISWFPLSNKCPKFSSSWSILLITEEHFISFSIHQNESSSYAINPNLLEALCSGL